MIYKLIFNKILANFAFQMGLAEMFTEKANFAGLAEKSYHKPYVSDIIQKASLRISEDGVVGTIATGLYFL